MDEYEKKECTKPEVWRKSETLWANVYSSGDIYFKDPYATRACLITGSYELAISKLTEMGYSKA